MKTYNCKNCGSESPYSHQKKNIFCSNECFQTWRYENETKPRIEAGGGVDHATLRKYLIREHTEVCSLCGQGPEWNGLALTLQVDHIDGNSDNNLPDNLRLLCPNCHTQQPTSKQRKRKITRRNKYLREYKMGG